MSVTLKGLCSEYDAYRQGHVPVPLVVNYHRLFVLKHEQHQYDDMAGRISFYGLSSCLQDGLH